MSKLPVLSGKDLVKILSKIGFVHIRTRGSHAILVKNEEKKIMIPVPLHKELAKGTLKNIISRAGLSLDNLLDLI